ncbi:hypothetical protein A3A66_02560 [Microgenomates group bacterium RIFCSPLOWO2_01_FULL_46_13]|nr:MAG: hypothetical protein A2783_03185 [Microgenomates group bacterium RIFCSPHIGHO2_01_FULL_45_11]OGV94853.1 MAG: hypothetical protein A3A66_02560 [Microgenomates group bacterium RIFCSPLOWO2_01_FULL_46_13]
MKVYFTAAISALSQYGDNYKKIVSSLEDLGHTVIADHILKKSLTQVLYQEKPEEHEAYYKSMIKNISSSDLLVAEVSFPSTVHVGHELTLALEKDKPVLALFIKGKRPVLFWGITSDKFYATEYELGDLKKTLKDAIEYLTEQMDTRFNFFISPKIATYLDWIAKKKRLPRAVYLRRLIEEDMKNDKNYSK